MKQEYSPSRISLSEMDKFKYMLYGSAYILSIDSLLYPLDTIKTNIMSLKSKQRNTSQFATQIIKRQGLKRLWRGFFASTLGSFPGHATYFFTLEYTQDLITNTFCSTNNTIESFILGFIGGLTAEVAGGLFFIPVDNVVQRLQTQNLNGFHHNARLYAGTRQVLSSIVNKSGISGLYRGYLAYVASYAPSSAVQWGSFEFSKRHTWKSISKIEQNIGHKFQYKDVLVNIISAGISSICAVTANNPLEILRIRTQLLNTYSRCDTKLYSQGYFNMASMIIKEEGYQAFYKGLKLRLLISIPSSILSLTGYEWIKKMAK